MKRCTTCREQFPATTTYFRRQKRGKFGVNSTCRKCEKESGRVYRINNAEKNRERTRVYYRKHKEFVDKKHEIYRNANRDKIKAHDRSRGKTAQRRCLSHVRHARDKALPHTFTGADWDRALTYFGDCCATCGRQTGLWGIIAQDHWIPSAKGGAYTPDNIVPLCHSTNGGSGGCNNSKGDRDATEWLVWKFGPRKTKQILKRIAEYFEWVKHQD